MRHQELNGAGSYPLADHDEFDRVCDYCARTVYSGTMRQVRIGRSTSWLCQRCFDAQQARFAAMDGAA